MAIDMQCPVGTDAVTARGTRRGTDALRCWVQNQNQNQRYFLGCVGPLQSTFQIQETSVTREPLGLGAAR